MKARVIAAQDASAWNEWLERFADSDAYYLAEYHLAYEANGDGRALAFVAESEAGSLFHPFLLRGIDRVGDEAVPEPQCDLETVYGYTGPLSTTSDPVFLSAAWESYETWCRDQHVVAEFIRFNPFLQNERWVATACQLSVDRETVVVRLSGSPADLWSSYPSVQRRNIRKASARGLTAAEAPVEDGLEAFQTLYAATMDRLQARSYYFFSPEYFAVLGTRLGRHLQLVVVRDGQQLAAAALYLRFGDRIHYHLGASDARYLDSGVNNLLHHTAALQAQAAGCQWLHLGGGRTPDPEDSLLRFKASFSKDRLPFLTCRQVHNQPAYDALCAAWMRQSQAGHRPNYFLLYRMPLEMAAGASPSFEPALGRVR